MKRIEKEKIKKAVKKEYKEARKWCRLDRGHCYRMMIDTSDAEIWADIFTSENSWKEYRSNDVEHLYTVPGSTSDTESGYVDDAIRKLEKAGWEVIQ